MITMWKHLIVGLCFIAKATKAQVDYNQEGLDCWDVCVFEAAEDSKSQIALDKLYSLITRIRHMRIFTGVSQVRPQRPFLSP